MKHVRSLLKDAPPGKIWLAHLTILLLLSLVASPILIHDSSGATYGSTIRGPIFIDGDVNFTPQNGVTSGSGTVEDPFVISGWEISTSTSNAIEIINARAYFVISNVTITTLGTPEMTGIIFSFSENGTVSDSYIHGCDRGIELWSCDNIQIKNCLIVGKVAEGYYKGFGVNIDFSRNVFITGNRITDCLNGIAYNYHYESTTIIDNVILRCVNAGAEIFRANGVLIEGNHFGFNDANSIVIESSNNVSIINNTIDGSRVGIRIGDIYLDSRAESIVRDNIISNCTEIGLRIDDAQFYRFYHNDFISNAIQVRATVAAIWDDGYPFGGNFWSDHAASDTLGGPLQNLTGADGICDTVRYVGARQDSYPLAHQKAVRDATVISGLPVTISPGEGSVRIEWNGSIHADGINHLTLFRGVGDEQTFSLVSAHYAENGSLVDTGLTNGISYSFKLIGTNVNGIAINSDVMSAIPRTVPDGPEITSVIEGNQTVMISWMPDFDGGSPILFYSVYRDGTHLDDVTNSIYLDTGLEIKVAYRYTVRAHNIVGAGNESAPVNATPYGTPSQPNDLHAEPTNGGVQLSWSAPTEDGGRNVDNYSIYRNGIWVVDTIELESYVGDLVNGVTYEFMVRAHNLAGNGPGATVNATPTAMVPESPYDVRASAGDGSIFVSWSVPMSDGGIPILNYTLYRTTNGGDWVLITTTSEPTISYIDLDIVAGYVYVYRVAASNALGSSVLSAPSNEVTARYLLNIAIFTDSTSTNLGVTVRMYGQVTYSDHQLPAASIVLSIAYSTNSGQLWTELPSVVTDNAGNFQISWIPPATGDYTVRVAWAGNNLFPAVESFLNVAIDSSVADSVLSVQSNSEISNFIFDTANKRLSFSVSGEDGTQGYVKIIVSKSILTDATEVNITLDGAEMSYTLSSTDQSWILMFTYHHSTHNVVADLNVDDAVDDGNGDDTGEDGIGERGTYLMLVSVIAVIVVALGYLMYRKRHL